MSEITSPEIPDKCAACPFVEQRLAFGEKMKADIAELTISVAEGDDNALDMTEEAHDVLSLGEDVYSGTLNDIQKVVEVIRLFPESANLSLSEFLQQYRTDDNELGVRAFTAWITKFPELLDSPMQISMAACVEGLEQIRIALDNQSAQSEEIKDEFLGALDVISESQDELHKLLAKMELMLAKNYRKIALAVDNCDEGVITETVGIFKKRTTHSCGSTALDKTVNVA